MAHNNLVVKLNLQIFGSRTHSRVLPFWWYLWISQCREGVAVLWPGVSACRLLVRTGYISFMYKTLVVSTRGIILRPLFCIKCTWFIYWWKWIQFSGLSYFHFPCQTTLIFGAVSFWICNRLGHIYFWAHWYLKDGLVINIWDTRFFITSCRDLCEKPDIFHKF